MYYYYTDTYKYMLYERMIITIKLGLFGHTHRPKRIITTHLPSPVCYLIYSILLLRYRSRPP